MPKNPEAWTLMQPHFDRIKWNWEHLWDFKTRNPHILPERGRIAVVDITHSIVNLGPELARIDPWRIGHYIVYLVGVIIVGIGVVVALL